MQARLTLPLLYTNLSVTEDHMSHCMGALLEAMVEQMTLLFLHSNLLVTEEQMSHCMAASNGEGDDSALPA